MSQRNRIVFATFVLTVALFLAAPPPSRATALRTGKAPAVNICDRVWSWLAALLPDGFSSKSVSGLEKEGSMVNPNGGTGSRVTAPAPLTSGSNEGSMVDPNGSK